MNAGVRFAMNCSQMSVIRNNVDLYEIVKLQTKMDKLVYSTELTDMPFANLMKWSIVTITCGLLDCIFRRGTKIYLFTKSS